MGFKVHKYIGSFGFLALSCGAFGQDLEQEDTDEVMLDAIIVNAKNPTTQKSSVDQDTISVKQAENLKDVLREVPGVDVGGSLGINQHVNIRGLNDDRLNVTIDGAKQEGFLFHHSGSTGIDMDILKRVDVSVGTNSVTNGSGALGGSVAYETVDAADLLKPGQKIGARVKTSYGSNNDEFQGGVTLFGRAYEDIDLLAYYNYRNLDSAEDGHYNDIHGEGEIQNYLLKSEWSINDENLLGISYEDYDNEGYYATRPDFPLTDDDGWNGTSYSDMERQTATINYDFTPEANDPDFSLIDFSVNGYLNEISFNRPRNETPSIGKVDTDGFDIKNTSIINTENINNVFNYGYEFYKERSTNKHAERGVNGEKADSNSFYFEDQLTFWERLHFTPGIRYDIYDADLAVVDDTYYEVSGSYFGQIDLTDNFSVFAGYTDVFSGPDLAEVYIGAGNNYIEADEPLRPEDGANLEYGALYNLPRVFTKDDNLNLSYTYFSTGFTNLNNAERRIECPFDPEQSCSRWVNTGPADIHGFEARAEYLYKTFKIDTSYSRSRSNIQATGEPINSRSNGNHDSGDTININLENFFEHYDIFVGWNSRIVDDLTVDDGNDKPSYDVHDAYLSWTPGTKFFDGNLEGLQVDMGLYNIFNEFYSSHASRSSGISETTGNDTSDREMGRNFKLTLRYQF